MASRNLADPSRWTVFDLRALRGPVSAARIGAVPPLLGQVTFAFGAIVVLSGSGPSHPLVSR